MAHDLLHSIALRTQLAGHNRLALLLFRLASRQLFGINVFKVQEVLRCPPLAFVPKSHALVRGMADLRGRPMPVLDLSMALGLPASDPADSYLVVTEFNRSVQGFLVSAVDRIVNVSVSEVHPPPLSGNQGFLTAITHFNEELIEIIDVEQVLAEVIGAAPTVSADILAFKPRPAASGQRPQVLIVDDSRTARTQVQQVLSQLGVDAIPLADGRQALTYLQRLAASGVAVSKKLAMVISDIEMPDMDGYTLTTEIRRDPQLADLYVLLHTSLSGIFNNAMIERVGANRFVPKYSPNDLANAVIERLRALAAA